MVVNQNLVGTRTKLGPSSMENPTNFWWEWKLDISEWFPNWTKTKIGCQMEIIGLISIDKPIKIGYHFGDNSTNICWKLNLVHRKMDLNLVPFWQQLDQYLMMIRGGRVTNSAQIWHQSNWPIVIELIRNYFNQSKPIDMQISRKSEPDWTGSNCNRLNLNWIKGEQRRDAGAAATSQLSVPFATLPCSKIDNKLVNPVMDKTRSVRASPGGQVLTS